MLRECVPFYFSMVIIIGKFRRGLGGAGGNENYLVKHWDDTLLIDHYSFLIHFVVTKRNVWVLLAVVLLGAVFVYSSVLYKHL